MTTQLGRGLDATANGSTRERRQDLGLRALAALHAIQRNGRVHGAANGVFDAPLATLGIVILELVRDDGSFELQIAPDALFLNRQQIRLDAAGSALFGLVRAEAAGRGIHGIAAREAVSATDLRALVSLLSTGTADAMSEQGDAANPLASLRLIVHRAVVQDPHARSHDSRLTDCYGHAVLFVDQTLLQLRAGAQAIPVWAASRVVQDFVELEREAPLRFLQLARTKAGGAAYWGYHAANVAVLSIAFGARLGMAKRRRHDLGMAALFHDVGLAALPIDLLHKDTALSQPEVAAIKAAPLFAARALLRERDVHAAALERAQGAFECHLDVSGAVPIGAVGRVLAICEAYDALTTTRPQRRAFSHLDALRLMHTDLAHRFDRKLLEAFPSVVEPLA
jgi:HD domain-containing protein